MTQTINYPLNTNFSGVNSLQANGVIGSGNNLLSGISDRLSIVDKTMKSAISQSDTTTAGAVRSEITAPAAAIGEFWYNFEFMLAEDFAPLLDPLILMQIHDTPDGGDGVKAVPFALYYTQVGDLAVYVPSATLPTEGANSRIIPINKASNSRWYKGTLHVLWATTAVGFREFYLDGVRVFRETDVPTMYSDTTGPYFKVGLYDATGNNRFGEASAFYRNISIFSGNDGYSVAMPISPRPRFGLVG
jgi:hypothetical protein